MCNRGRQDQVWVCLVRDSLYKRRKKIGKKKDKNELELSHGVCRDKCGQLDTTLDGKRKRPYEKILGILLVGTVVTNWPHTKVPTPKKTHQAHWVNVSGAVENA